MPLLARATVVASALALSVPLSASAAWSPPGAIFTSPTVVSDQPAVAGPAGNASMVWAISDGFNNVSQIEFSEQHQGAWSAPARLPNSPAFTIEPTLTVSPDRSLYVGYVDVGNAQGGSRIERRAPNGRWESPERLKPAGSAPLVAVDAMGNATAVWIGVLSSTSEAIYYATRAASVTTFSTPVALRRVSGYVRGLVLSYAPTGTIAVAWDTENTNFQPTGAETTSRIRNNAWSPILALRNLAPSTSFGNPGLAVDAAGITTVLWEAATPNPGPARVLSIRRNGTGSFTRPVVLFSQPAVGGTASSPVDLGTAAALADPRGDVVALWDACIDPCYQARETAATYLAGKGWNAPTQVGPYGDSPIVPTLGAAADGSIAAAGWVDFTSSTLRLITAMPSIGKWSLPTNEDTGIAWRNAGFAFAHNAVDALFPTFDQANQIFSMQSSTYAGGASPAFAAGAVAESGYATLRSSHKLRSSFMLQSAPAHRVAAARPLPIAAAVTNAASVTNFTLPTPSSNPVQLINGPDGNVWFTESGSGKIGSITPSGKLLERVSPAAFAAPSGLVVGPDGNVWFTDPGNDTIGSVSVAGAFRIFHLPPQQLHLPSAIVSGPGGKLCFLEYGPTGVLATITTGGAISELTTPASSYGSSDLTVGKDGNIWYLGNSSPYGVVRFNPAGTAAVFPAPYNFGPYVASAPNGVLWFDGNKALGRITLQGAYQPEIPISTGRGNVSGLTFAPDGSVWFAVPRLGALEHRLKNGSIKTYGVAPGSDRPLVAKDGSIWFVNVYSNSIGRLQP